MTEADTAGPTTPPGNQESASPSALARGGGAAAVAVQRYGIVILFVALFGLLWATAPNFLSVTNMLNLLSANAALGITACGMTFVIISGGFDLSVGAVFALAGVAAAWLAIRIGTPLGLTLGLLLGLLLGFFNGAIIMGFRVHSFLATLASQIMFRALAVGITGGFFLEVPDPSFQVPGRGGIGGLTYQILAFFGSSRQRCGRFWRVQSSVDTCTRWGEH